MAAAKKKAAKKAVKEVVAKEETCTDVALYDEAYGTEDIDNDDLIIPKILVMQGMSELVTDGKARIGDMIDSLSHEVLGDVKRPIEFIPFKTFKTWNEFENDKYMRTIPLTADNKHLAIEEDVTFEDGTEVHITRNKVFNVYCLLPHQIETGEFLPFVLAFRRTSYYTGRKMATELKKLSMFKKPAFSKIFELSSHKQTNDKGTYFTFDIKKIGNAPESHQKECMDWYKAVKGQEIDNSDMKSKDETSTEKTVSPNADPGAEEESFSV